jgi:hypothetical protein
MFRLDNKGDIEVNEAVICDWKTDTPISTPALRHILLLIEWRGEQLGAARFCCAYLIVPIFIG